MLSVRKVLTGLTGAIAIFLVTAAVAWACTTSGGASYFRVAPEVFPKSPAAAVPVNVSGASNGGPPAGTVTSPNPPFNGTAPLYFAQSNVDSNIYCQATTPAIGSVTVVNKSTVGGNVAGYANVLEGTGSVPPSRLSTPGKYTINIGGDKNWCVPVFVV